MFHFPANFSGTDLLDEYNGLSKHLQDNINGVKQNQRAISISWQFSDKDIL